MRTPNPYGGAEAISIMRTADIARSDPILAGLMVRCSESGGEVVVALLRSFSPRERPEIVLSADGAVTRFRATVVPPGVGIEVVVEHDVNGPCPDRQRRCRS